MGDRSVTPGAAGIGSGNDAAYRQMDFVQIWSTPLVEACNAGVRLR